MWDDDTKTITAYNEAYIVKATINQTTMTVNGIEKEIDVAPMVVCERTLVPVRFIAEAFDCKVEWDGDNKTVDIITKEIDYSELEKDINTENSNEIKNENRTDNTAIYSNNTLSYYKGTLAPTYTSVTGVEMKAQLSLDDETPVYIYDYYFDTDYVAEYLNELQKLGWMVFGDDDKSTDNIYECAFVNVKTKQLIVFDVMWDLEEIWISAKAVNN